MHCESVTGRVYATTTSTTEDKNNNPFAIEKTYLARFRGVGCVDSNSVATDSAEASSFSSLR
jgi:hypothetical protein